MCLSHDGRWSCLCRYRCGGNPPRSCPWGICPGKWHLCTQGDTHMHLWCGHTFPHCGTSRCSGSCHPIYLASTLARGNGKSLVSFSVSELEASIFSNYSLTQIPSNMFCSTSWRNLQPGGVEKCAICLGVGLFL